MYYASKNSPVVDESVLNRDGNVKPRRSTDLGYPPRSSTRASAVSDQNIILFQTFILRQCVLTVASYQKVICQSEVFLKLSFSPATI